MNNSYHPLYQQILLIILDGWGYSEETIHNAIIQANPEYFDYLWKTYPHTLLPASGEAVGLPQGVIGTSEIGHMIIGSGKILYTDLLRINKAIALHELQKNEAIMKLFGHVKQCKSTLHFIGLLSPAGVHSHQDHLFAMLRLAKDEGLSDVAVHVITDGRDTPPKSAIHFIAELEHVITELGIGRIATIAGRYYAMDRDKNWDRTQKEVDALFGAHGVIHERTNPVEIIQEEYSQGVSDEFIVPIIIREPNGNATIIKQNDGVFLYNFRPDRARQLSQKIAEKQQSLNLCFVTMTQYDPTINSLVAFPPQKIETTLSSELAKAGLTQTHIAETEKYAHVTYFLNGGDEKPHYHEEFVLIDSRKDIPTHDLAPEMRAKEIADKAIDSINKGTNFIVINFANADMVGHTGKWEATIQAIQTLDVQMKRVVEAILAKNGIALVTADHGNAELMFDEKNNQPHTAHTLNPVPFILTVKGVILNEGTLADIAPTILSLFKLPVPKTMTGKSLIT